MMLLLRSVILALGLALPAQAAELVMIDQQGCHYCEQWTEEIGPIYPKSEEGKYAPLRRVDIRAIPDNLKLAAPPAYTPTFILVEDGRELARLEGYPGADFFWSMISRMFTDHTDYRDPKS